MWISRKVALPWEFSLDNWFQVLTFVEKIQEVLYYLWIKKPCVQWIVSIWLYKKGDTSFGFYNLFSRLPVMYVTTCFNAYSVIKQLYYFLHFVIKFTGWKEVWFLIVFLQTSDNENGTGLAGSELSRPAEGLVAT